MTERAAEPGVGLSPAMVAHLWPELAGGLEGA
jgi:hypothetical protein